MRKVFFFVDSSKQPKLSFAFSFMGHTFLFSFFFFMEGDSKILFQLFSQEDNYIQLYLEIVSREGQKIEFDSIADELYKRFL